VGDDRLSLVAIEPVEKSGRGQEHGVVGGQADSDGVHRR
jgi:hypothetical protein